MNDFIDPHQQMVQEGGVRIPPELYVTVTTEFQVGWDSLSGPQQQHIIIMTSHRIRANNAEKEEEDNADDIADINDAQDRLQEDGRMVFVNDDDDDGEAGEDEDEDDDDDGNDHDDRDQNEEDTDMDDTDDDDDDSYDGNSSDDDTIPTPEEVEFTYMYPQDFIGRDGSINWRDVVAAGRYFRLRIDPSCTSILLKQFQNCINKWLIEISIPKNSTLTQIQRNAFRDCKNLPRITNGLPATLIIHEDEAFGNCQSLKGKLVIPQSVLFLGDCCFRDCTGLTSVVFEASTSATTRTQQTSVVLGESCFCGCRELRSVRLPQTLAIIPRHCFCWCFKLTDISIPTSVQTIEQWSFAACISLERISIRAFSQVRFGSNILHGCSSLSIIQMYPWLYPKLFEAMYKDPSFIYKFFHQYHLQIMEVEESS